MDAVRIVARATEEHLRRPRATCLADVSVVAGLAEAPQISARALTDEGDRFRAGERLLDRHLLRVPTGVDRGGQRRACLDLPVRFKTDAPLAGRTPTPVSTLVAVIAEHRFVRSEVANVVSREERDAGWIQAFFLEPNEERKEREQLVRLEQK